MDGSSSKFQLVIAKYGGDNIGEYLDNNGLLDTDTIGSANLIVEDCKLKYEADELGDAVISLAEAVTFTIGDANIPLKAVFLRDKTTGYVMGYSINLVSFSVTNEVVFDDDVIFWDIVGLNNNG